MTALQQAQKLKVAIQDARILFDNVLDVHNELEVQFCAQALSDVLIMAGNDVAAMVASFREQEATRLKQK